MMDRHVRTRGAPRPSPAASAGSILPALSVWTGSRSSWVEVAREESECVPQAMRQDRRPQIAAEHEVEGG